MSSSLRNPDLSFADLLPQITRNRVLICSFGVFPLRILGQKAIRLCRKTWDPVSKCPIAVAHLREFRYIT